MSNPFIEKDMRFSIPSKQIETLSPTRFSKLSSQNDSEYSFKFRSISLTNSLSLTSLVPSPQKDLKNENGLKSPKLVSEKVESPSSDLSFARSKVYSNESPKAQTASPKSDLMNYSPKHSWKPSSLSSRNSKKLSLNLNSPLNSNTSRMLSPSPTAKSHSEIPKHSSIFKDEGGISRDESAYTTNLREGDVSLKNAEGSKLLELENPRNSLSASDAINQDAINSDAINLDIIKQMSKIDSITSPSLHSSSSPPKPKPPLISTSSFASTVLKTPAITSTPTLPPLLQKPQKKSLNIDDSPTAFNTNSPHTLQSPFDTVQASKPLNSQHSYNLDLADASNLQGAYNSKLHGIYNSEPVGPYTSDPHPVESFNSSQPGPFNSLNPHSYKPLNSPPLITKFPSNADQTSFTTLNGSPHYIAYSDPIYTTITIKSIVPEELQELNQLNAYPTGPRNVLNNQIFLYSDPIGVLDINEYDLIVNVARECQNLSSKLTNQQMGSKEYLTIPWTHTSSISKDLPLIISQIDHFYNKGLKILIHCQCGVSRSACVVVAYFMFKFNLAVNDAYELLKLGTVSPVNKNIFDLGFTVDTCDRICPNMSLIFELMEYAEKLNIGKMNEASPVEDGDTLANYN